MNIIIDDLHKRIGLHAPRPTPYNLQMVDQTTTKLVGMIRDVRINIHGIPYTVTFIVVNNIVVDDSYFMLLGRPWLRNAKIFHDWGTNMITIEGNGTTCVILITKKLGHNT